MGGRLPGFPAALGCGGRLDHQPAPGTTAANRIHYERDLIWDPRPRTVGRLQPPYPDTLPAWEKWHWFEFISSRNNVRSQVPFRIPDPVTGEPARLLARFWGAGYTARAPPPDHHMQMDVNGTTVCQKTWDDLTHGDA